MLSSESGLRGRLVVWLATQQELQARAALDETSNRKVAAKQQLKTLQATLTARLATLTSTLELTREKMGVVRGKLRREEAEEAPHAMADEWTGALEAHALSMHILQSESKDTQKALDSIDRALTSHQPEMKKSHHHRNSSAAHNFLNLPPNHRDRLAMRSQSCVEQHVLAVINECMATLDSVRTEEMEIHRRLQHAVSSREAVQSRKHANLVQDAQPWQISRDSVESQYILECLCVYLGQWLRQSEGVACQGDRAKGMDGQKLMFTFDVLQGPLLDSGVCMDKTQCARLKGLLLRYGFLTAVSSSSSSPASSSSSSCSSADSQYSERFCFPWSLRLTQGVFLTPSIPLRYRKSGWLDTATGWRTVRKFWVLEPHTLRLYSCVNEDDDPGEVYWLSEHCRLRLLRSRALTSEVEVDSDVMHDGVEGVTLAQMCNDPKASQFCFSIAFHQEQNNTSELVLIANNAKAFAEWVRVLRDSCRLMLTTPVQPACLSFHQGAVLREGREKKQEESATTLSTRPIHSSNDGFRSYHPARDGLSITPLPRASVDLTLAQRFLVLRNNVFHSGAIPSLSLKQDFELIKRINSLAEEITGLLKTKHTPDGHTLMELQFDMLSAADPSSISSPPPSSSSSSSSSSSLLDNDVCAMLYGICEDVGKLCQHILGTSDQNIGRLVHTFLVTFHELYDCVVQCRQCGRNHARVDVKKQGDVQEAVRGLAGDVHVHVHADRRETGDAEYCTHESHHTDFLRTVKRCIVEDLAPFFTDLCGVFAGPFFFEAVVKQDVVTPKLNRVRSGLNRLSLSLSRSKKGSDQHSGTSGDHAAAAAALQQRQHSVAQTMRLIIEQQISKTLFHAVYDTVFVCVYIPLYAERDAQIAAKVLAFDESSLNDASPVREGEAGGEEVAEAGKHYLERIAGSQNPFEKTQLVAELVCMLSSSSPGGPSATLGSSTDAKRQQQRRSSQPMTTDDILPLFIRALVRARPAHIAADLMFMKDFALPASKSNLHGYSLATLEGALVFLLNQKQV